MRVLPCRRIRRASAPDADTRVASEDRVLPTFSLGAASNYAMLSEGGGSNDTLQLAHVTTNTTGSGPGQGGGIGNSGVDMAGLSKVNGSSTINGRIDFSAPDTGQFSGTDSGNVITGGVNHNVAPVTSTLNTANALPTQSWFRLRKNRRSVSDKKRGGLNRASTFGLKRPRVRAQFHLEPFEPRTLLSAIVITDHQAYAPGACVNITGSGFGSRETVDLQVVNEATGVAYPSWKATGGTNGDFTSTWTVPSDAVGDTLQLSATGEAHGSTAQAAFTGGATITTDRRDYPPGSAANISGVGWQPDETVSLEVFNETTKTDETDWTATADSRGDVSTTLTIGNWVGDTLRLTATGETSGLTARNTFTDSLAVSATISPTTAVVGQPQNYTFTLSVDNNSDSALSATVEVPSISNDPSDITITSNPGGWSAALNTSTTPHEIDLTGTTPVEHNGTDLVFTFSATATTAGTATWTTTAYDGENQTGSSDQPSPQPK